MTNQALNERTKKCCLEAIQTNGGEAAGRVIHEYVASRSADIPFYGPPHTYVALAQLEKAKKIRYIGDDDMAPRTYAINA